MENQIKIEHYPISFNERIKSLSYLYLIVLVIFGLLSVVYNTKNILGFMIAVSIIFGIITLYKIYRHTHFLVDFESDSNYVKILYLDFKDEKIIETDLESIEIKLINTSAKGNFNCEVKLKVENIKFTIENNFQWDFAEMKQIFEFIQYHKKIKLSEEDKFTLSRIQNHLDKNIF